MPESNFYTIGLGRARGHEPAQRGGVARYGRAPAGVLELVLPQARRPPAGDPRDEHVAESARVTENMVDLAVNVLAVKFWL